MANRKSYTGFPTSHQPRFYAAPNFLKMGIKLCKCTTGYYREGSDQDIGRIVETKISIYRKKLRFVLYIKLTCTWSKICILICCVCVIVRF